MSIGNVPLSNKRLTYVDVGSRAADGGKRRHCSSSTVVFRLARPKRLKPTTMTLSILLTHSAHSVNIMPIDDLHGAVCTCWQRRTDIKRTLPSKYSTVSIFTSQMLNFPAVKIESVFVISRRGLR